MHTKYLHETGQVIGPKTFKEGTWQADAVAGGRVFYGNTAVDAVRQYREVEQRVEEVETQKREIAAINSARLATANTTELIAA